MNLDDVIECAGAPRDLGVAQGQALGPEIRRHLERVGRARTGRRLAGLRAFASGSALGGGMGREIVRHYPHLAERMTGIARGAGVSFEGLMEQFTADDGPAAVGAPGDNRTGAVSGAQPAGAGCLVMRGLDDVPEQSWVVRRSTPEHGFRSIELTRPWLASAVAGVNESGLAVAIAPGRRPAEPALAPSCQLLVQECLQRFEETGPALDWCLKRPSSGAAGLVLADRSGDVAMVSVEGDRRRTVPSSDGVAVAGLDDEGQAQLRKRYREAGGLVTEALDAALPGVGQVWLDCATAGLTLRPHDAEAIVLTLD